MMAIFKILVSGTLTWAAIELGKRSGKLGGLMLSLPITSIIALCWLWFETRDPAKIASVSTETVIFILPSFVFFIALSALLSRQVSFTISFTASIVLTLLAYAIFFKIRSA
jgi:hypothetical protein